MEDEGVERAKKYSEKGDLRMFADSTTCTKAHAPSVRSLDGASELFNWSGQSLLFEGVAGDGRDVPCEWWGAASVAMGQNNPPPPQVKKAINRKGTITRPRWNTFFTVIAKLTFNINLTVSPIVG